MRAPIRPDSEPVLQTVLGILSARPALSLEIQGHTDNVGSGEYNQKLSETRAASVVAVGAILAVFHDVLIACAALAAAWLCVFLAYDVTRARRVLAQWAGRLRPSVAP